MATLIVSIVVALLVLAAIVGLLVRARRAERAGQITEKAPEQPSTPPPEPVAPVGDAADEEVAAPEEPGEEAPPAYKDRLGKSRGLFASVRARIGRGRLDEEAIADLEEALLRSDVGVATTDQILATVRAAALEQRVDGDDALVELVRTELVSLLETAPDGGPVDRSLSREVDDGRVPVWLFVGVNGVGKTTTIGKLATRESNEGLRVLLAAGDTFRAAAADQLGLWAERSGAEIVRGAEGGDPSSVVFDAVQAAGARGADLVLADTAGRLHTKVNLVEELKKIRRVADREPGQVVEVLLVLDATTGQNAVSQAREFSEAVDATGVVLTKLDGTARGGVVVAISCELGLPVKLVGLGEGAADLVPFDPASFVDALLEP
jgi:fused signal recognition particle receptor